METPSKNETRNATAGGNLKPLKEYGFTEEEAGDIAVVLYLYDQWTDAFLSEPQDPRYKELIRDFNNDSDIGTLLLAGFMGGFCEGLELAIKVEESKAGKDSA